MATPVTTASNVTKSGFSWSISDLNNTWSFTYYKNAYVQVYLGATYIGSSSTFNPTGSGTTATGTYSGSLNEGKTYTVNGYATAANGTAYPGGSTTILIPAPPQGTLSVSATANSASIINVSWSGVTGATKYIVYANDNAGSGDYYKGETNGTGSSLNITVSREYWNYLIKVTPSNAQGDGNTGSTNVMTKDVTPPTITNFYASNIQAKSITMYASATDSGIGVSGFYFYSSPDNVNWSGANNVYQSGGAASHPFTGLQADKAYYFRVSAYDGQLNLSGTSGTSYRTLADRPTELNWTNRTGGGVANFDVTALQWNNLTAKINEFRYYITGITTNYAFTQVTKGDSFNCDLMNQARNVLWELKSYMTGSYVNGSLLPTVKKSGDTIFASDLNNLVRSMNSIYK